MIQVPKDSTYFNRGKPSNDQKYHEEGRRNDEFETNKAPCITIQFGQHILVINILCSKLIKQHRYTDHGNNKKRPAYKTKNGIIQLERW